MGLFMIIIGIIGTLFLFVYINIELNSLQKTTETLISEIKNHYGIK
jgi:hypothetical protein